MLHTKKKLGFGQQYVRSISVRSASVCVLGQSLQGFCPDRALSPCRNVQTAEAKLSKLQMEKEAQEAKQAAASKSAVSSKDLAAMAEAAYRSVPPTAAAGQSAAGAGRAAYASERPFLSLAALQTFSGAAKVQRGEDLGLRPHDGQSAPYPAIVKSFA